MMVILEAVSGPILGRRIEIPADSIMRIGRTGKSDYAIAEDGYLSGMHFSVECDGTQCRIQDLGSSNGTFVNGTRITEHVAREGDSIVAGGSTFRVHIDALPMTTGVGMPRVSTAPVIVSNQTLSDSGYSPAETVLLNALYKPGEQVFAVVDSSRDSRIPAFLDASGETHFDLGPGVFLVSLHADSRLAHVLIKDGWGRGWGFYGTSKDGIENIRAHFTSFVKLHTSTGIEMTFRFWDPRVLRALLPVMPEEEAKAFFGPCERIIVEGEKPGGALEFSRTSRQQNISLA